jgi:hypothetical protein
MQHPSRERRASQDNLSARTGSDRHVIKFITLRIMYRNYFQCGVSAVWCRSGLYRVVRRNEMEISD